MGSVLEMKRCRLNSLSNDDRWTIGHNELRALRKQFEEKKIDEKTLEKRKKTIVDFISGSSNRMNSDGVIVEFYVAQSDG